VDRVYSAQLESSIGCIQQCVVQWVNHSRPQNASNTVPVTVLPVCRMNVPADTMAERDILVFRMCRARSIPVCMLLSGGYSRHGTAAIARSLTSIIKEHQ
jgi:hypothetical protein